MRTLVTWACLTLFSTTALAAQSAIPRDSIVTAGAHRIWIIDPDRATFYVVLDDTGSTQVEAIQRSRTSLPAVVAALRRFSRAVSADPPIMVHVGPRPSSNPYDPRQQPIPFIARSMVRVSAVRVDSFPAVFEAIAAAGASISTITFFSSVMDSVRKARLPELVAVARGEAEAIAAALGGALGELIDVQSAGGVGYEVPTTLMLDSRYNANLAIPQVNVPSTVTLRYRLIRP